MVVKCEEVLQTIEGLSDATPPDEMLTALESMLSLMGNILQVKYSLVDNTQVYPQGRIPVCPKCFWPLLLRKGWIL